METLRIQKSKISNKKWQSGRLDSSFLSNSEERLNSSQAKKDEGQIGYH